MAILGYGKLPTYLSLLDLQDGLARNKSNSPIIDARKSVRILVIDDEEFSPLTNLKRNSFNVVRIDGVDHIEDVKDYSVVLVDLQGVGRNLNPAGQGAHLIQQIKKAYPEKYVVAYTGGATATLTSLAAEFADRYTTKDTSIEKWCDILDVAVLEVSHPVQVWEKFRHRLLNQGVTPLQLAALEDTYVRGVLNDSNNLSASLAQRATEIGIGPDVRNIIAGLIANSIFKLIVG